MVGEIIRVKTQEDKVICDGIILSSSVSGILIVMFFPSHEHVNSFAEIAKHKHINLKVGELGLKQGNWEKLPTHINKDEIPNEIMLARRGFFGDLNVCTYDQAGNLLREEIVASLPENLSEDGLHGYEAAEVVLRNFFGGGSP
nr:hypothetical protein [uncultured Celeribacter sp.]